MRVRVRRVLGGPALLKRLEGAEAGLSEVIGAAKEEPWQFYLEAGGEGVEVYAWDRSCAYGYVNPLGLSEPLCGQAVVVRRDGIELVDLGPWPRGEPTPRALADELLRLSATLKEKAAVAFSGGLDSSILARAFEGAVLINASFEGTVDRENAREAARALGAQVDFVEPSEDHLRAALSLYVSPMDASLFAGFLAVSRRAHELGLRYVIAGQMADELFGGYAKYRSIPLDSLPEVLNRDFLRGRLGLMRDSRAMAEGGCEALFPYAAGLVPGIAMGMEPALRVNKEALRAAARMLGLPEEIEKRKKKAFQYGSGIERALRGYLRRLTGT